MQETLHVVKRQRKQVTGVVKKDLRVKLGLKGTGEENHVYRSGDRSVFMAAIPRYLSFSTFLFWVHSMYDHNMSTSTTTKYQLSAVSGFFEHEDEPEDPKFRAVRG